MIHLTTILRDQTRYPALEPRRVPTIREPKQRAATECIISTQFILSCLKDLQIHVNYVITIP